MLSTFGTEMRNFMIFLSFRFYVKSILKSLEVLKLPFSPFLKLRIWLIWSISAFKKCKNSWRSKFRTSQFAKMAHFALLDSPKLISRKIWVTKKFWNSHTVFTQYSNFFPWIQKLWKPSDQMFWTIFSVEINVECSKFKWLQVRFDQKFFVWILPTW